jgi:hypothetical protein
MAAWSSGLVTSGVLSVTGTGTIVMPGWPVGSSASGTAVCAGLFDGHINS